MELWDVYDENRQKTGKIIERGTSWGNEKYHLIVHVAIFDEKGRMLIQHRSPAKRAWANLWDLSAGGSAVAGEDSRQAAERETWEELGLSIHLEDVRPHFSINYERGFDDFYTVMIPKINPAAITPRDDEVDQVRLATREEVLEMLHNGSFTPYFPGVLELLWDVRDNYDGAICQTV